MSDTRFWLRFQVISARTVLWGVLGIWVILLCGWLALLDWALPQMASWRGELEKEATQLVGLQVQIGEIKAYRFGLLPEFEMKDIVIRDQAHQSVLWLPHVVGLLSPRYLWNHSFEQLYIQGLDLSVRRDVSGQLFVAGFPIGKQQTNSSQFTDWLLSQREVVLQNASVDFQDEKLGLPLKHFGQIDAVMRNSAKAHWFSVRGNPPRGLGQSWQWRAKLKEPWLNRSGNRFSNWSGDMFLQMGDVNGGALNAYIPAALGIDVHSMQGALRAWAELKQGKLSSTTVDAALNQIHLTERDLNQSFALRAFKGRLLLDLDANTWKVNSQNLQFVTEQGAQWTRGDARVTFTKAHDKQLQQTQIELDHIALDALYALGNQWTTTGSLRSWLERYPVRGQMDHLELSWSGSPQTASAWLNAVKAKGRVRDVALGRATDVTQPAIEGLTTDFEFTPQSGQAQVELHKGWVTVPGIWEDPRVMVDALKSKISWTRKGRDITFQAQDLTLRNADLDASADISWKSQAGNLPGVLDLTAEVHQGLANAVYRYLPLVIHKEARDYVRGAVKSGVGEKASFRIKGDLSRFPFRNPKDGEFHVEVAAKGVVFDYAPANVLGAQPKPWPVLSELEGQLIFDRATLSIENATANLLVANKSGSTLRVKGIKARINDIETLSSLLKVQGEIEGRLEDFVHINAASALSKLSHDALQDAMAQGIGVMQLGFEFPLNRPSEAKVDGRFVLQADRLQISNSTPELHKIKALTTFNEHGFAFKDAQGEALGGPVKLSASTLDQAHQYSMRVSGSGTASAAGMQSTTQFPFLSWIGKSASGKTDYSFAMQMVQGRPSIEVKTNLKGLALNLPAPFAKTAQTVLPVVYTLRPIEKTENSLLDVRLDGWGSARYWVSPTAVLKGVIAVGEPPADNPVLPNTGVSARITLDKINVDEWTALLDQGAGPAGRSSASTEDPGYLPSTLALKVKALQWQNHSLHDVVLGGSRVGARWQANINSQELNGYVEYKPTPRGAAVYARLTRFVVSPDATTNQVEQVLSENTPSLPSLDLVIDDFQWKGRSLGRLELQASNRLSNRRVQEWRLTHLQLSMPEAQLVASGNWVPINDRSIPTAIHEKRLALEFTLNVNDAGELLKRFKLPDTLRRGRGDLKGEIAWVGSPFSLDVPSLSGQFHVDIGSGQFLKADPGIAKLLGVLSLQSLPRRLTLDFRDVFSEGFAFDFIRGDVKIENGIAQTNNLQMKGVNAAVLMEGSADIAKETQSLHVVVVPEINAGTASLIATAINPAIGIGSFIAQLVLRKPLIRSTTQTFRIEGSFSNPEVTKVEEPVPTEKEEKAP